MNHHSDSFLDNESNRKQICLIISLFPVGNTKMGHFFFQLYKLKMKHVVSYFFKSPLDYSSLYT